MRLPNFPRMVAQPPALGGCRLFALTGLLEVKITSGDAQDSRSTHKARTMSNSRSIPETSPAGSGGKSRPWQLAMFSRSLKKQQKLSLLLEQIGEASDRDCLLVTHGDNNGALNHHLRAHGGCWTWVENEEKQISEIEGLLGEPVLRGDPARLPVDDASFDLAVSIDVHEHLDRPESFNRELHRAVRAGGTVIVTTPNGDLDKPLVALKNRLGMTKEIYGHKVIGYTVGEHEKMLERAGLRPVTAGSYARFFTELLELGINFGYVKVLSRKSGAKVETGNIAPTSQERLRAVDKQYRLYSMIYPLLYAVSRLDLVLLGTTGYAVSVVSQKPE